MSAKDIAAGVLLGGALVIATISVIGAFVARRPEDKLHYLTPVATLSPTLVFVALVIRESLNVRGLYMLVVLVVMLGVQPILSHYTGRALRLHENGTWRLGTRRNPR